MAKEVAGLIKLQIKGGAANPAPPVGPALGAKGVNIMEFCKQFNARTQDQAGKIVPVIITVYTDKSFDFVLKTPPVAVQLKEMSKAQKGSGEPNRVKVASVTWEQVRQIAEAKMPDLNCFTVESAAGCVAEKEKKYASSLPSKAMQEAVKKVTGKNYREVVKGISQQGQS